MIDRKFVVAFYATAIVLAILVIALIEQAA